MRLEGLDPPPRGKSPRGISPHFVMGSKLFAAERYATEIAFIHNQSIFALVASIGLAGAAMPASAGLFSATGPVIAILANELFVGEAEGHLSGAGTLAIRSQKDPELTCNGQFTSNGKLGGSGRMHCSDGTDAVFHFERLTVLRGFGAGSFTRGAMSFAYGLTAEEAGTYLKLPEGKRLGLNGSELKLVDL